MRLGETVCHEPPFVETIRTEWTAWGFGPGPPRLAWALATGGRRSISKVVGLIFAEGGSRPLLAVKMARVPESIAGLTREATALRALAGLGPGGQPGVPRFLFQTGGAYTTAVGETAVWGTPLSGLVRPRTYRDLAITAAEWLARLACDTRAPAPAGRQRIAPVLAEFGECFAPIIGADQMRATQDMVAPLEALPRVFEQRDFAPWNVFITPERTLAVLDWESSELAGLPALDLVYFLTFLALSADGLGHAPRSTVEAESFLRRYREGTDPSTFIGRVHQECLNLYCQRIGLEAGLLRPLRLFAWMLHARSEYERLVADDRGLPTREALRRSVFARFWVEELRRCGR
jgi:aminoglycoside phosphotransferase (APT) family kinase protein